MGKGKKNFWKNSPSPPPNILPLPSKTFIVLGQECTHRMYMAFLFHFAMLQAEKKAIAGVFTLYKLHVKYSNYQGQGLCQAQQ